MKSFILVAVILQLVIIGIKTDGKYQFGDIIEFPRKCIGNKPKLSHFAIYVGPESGVNVGQGDNDIFHRTGDTGKHSCKFGKLEDTREGSNDTKNNYLDAITPKKNRETDKIKKRIEKRKGDGCGKYNALVRNCEHLATFVRYEDSLSLQKGTVAGCVLVVNYIKENNIKKKHKEEIKKEREEEIKKEHEEEIKKKYDEVTKRDASTQTDENNNLSPCEDNPS